MKCDWLQLLSCPVVDEDSRVNNQFASTLSAVMRVLDFQPMAGPNGVARTMEVKLMVPGKAERLVQASGIRRVEVQSGAVWLTCTPANGDFVLLPGMAFDLRGGWPITIEALEPANVIFSRET